MIELSYKKIGGILTLVVLMTGGVSLYIIDDIEGDYKNCREGWQLNEITGKYDCLFREISEYCFKLSSSGYRCYIGQFVNVTPLKQKINLSNDTVLIEFIDKLVDSKVRQCNRIRIPSELKNCDIDYSNSKFLFLYSSYSQSVFNPNSMKKLNMTLYDAFTKKLSEIKCIEVIPDICVEYTGSPDDEINTKLKSWVETI